MIIIKKSPTADSRCCDAKNINKETLIKSTQLHRRDVFRSMDFFSKLIEDAGFKTLSHDKYRSKEQEII